MINQILKHENMSVWMQYYPSVILQHCYTAILAAILISAESHAAHIHPLNDLKVIEVPISNTGLTRITVKGDRIADVFGVAGEYVMEADETQGQVFIRPLEPALNPISLTLTTEAGHTQDLRLIPKSQVPETLILQQSDVEKVKAVTEQSLTRNEIEDLLYACAEGRIPVGYRNVKLDIPSSSSPSLLTHEITNGKLRGLTYEVRNKATIPWILSESGFAKTLSLDVIAVLMPQKYLKPGEKTHVFIAVRSH